MTGLPIFRSRRALWNNKLTMVAEFNPYRTLLKIDSDDSPPDHYTLLGISHFEPDSEAIENAAEKRISFLQDLANSEYLDESQKLLNEVAAARRCLLSPHEKIAYDEGLRRRQEKDRANPKSDKPKTATTSRSRRKKSHKTANIVTLVMLAVVSVLALIVFLPPMTSGSKPNLVLDWPINERDGATLSIDAKAVDIPDEQPAKLNVPEGRHQLLVRRQGFRDIAQTINFSSATTQVKLRWIPE